MFDQTLRAIDLQLGNFVAQFAHSHDAPKLRELVSLLSLSSAAGHSCLPVAVLEQQNILTPSQLSKIQSRNTTVIGSSLKDLTPLVLDQSHLYLQRNFNDECRVAAHLISRAATPLDYSGNDLASRLDRLFDGASDEQRNAAITATRGLFSVIVGGPGTGKTTTVVRVLATLTELRTRLAKAPSILLLAPTGKAAARMGESIKQQITGLETDELSRNAIPTTAHTIHRALGWKHGGFQHNQHNPLVADIVLVDEASMVDTKLMLALLNALHPQAQLILLGDQNQLASVEAGSVLNDIFQAAETPRSKLQPHLAKLTKSFRFKDDAGIGRLASLVNSDTDEARAALQLLGCESVAELDHIRELDINRISQPYQLYLELVQANAEPREIFNAFAKWRILTALRDTEYGVAQLNEAVERALSAKGLLSNHLVHYAGRPIMVTQNDYAQQLFNGDIGIILPTENGLRAFFEVEGGGFRQLLPARLPSVETAFVMTVHKSQGSEFNHCALVLPPEEQGKHILSKELIYTAITRAKESFLLVASDATFIKGCNHRTTRYSMLAQRLILG